MKILSNFFKKEPSQDDIEFTIIQNAMSKGVLDYLNSDDWNSSYCFSDDTIKVNGYERRVGISLIEKPHLVWARVFFDGSMFTTSYNHIYRFTYQELNECLDQITGSIKSMNNRFVAQSLEKEQFKKDEAFYRGLLMKRFNIK